MKDSQQRWGGKTIRLLCSHSAGEEGHAVKVGVQVMDFEFPDGPSRRSAVGGVAAETNRHVRAEDSEHTTIAIEDEWTQVAFCGEVAGCLTVVVDGNFDRLYETRRKVSLQPRTAFRYKVGDVTVLPDNF